MKKLLQNYRPFLLPLLLIPLLLLTACPDKKPEETAEPASLFGKWKLEVIGYTHKADLRPPQDTHVWIEFEKIAAISGYTCRFNGQAAPNYYFGDVIATRKGNDGSMLFGGIASTKMGSTKIANTQFEVEYFNLLPQADTYTLKQNSLVIHCKNGEKLFYSKQSN